MYYMMHLQALKGIICFLNYLNLYGPVDFLILPRPLLHRRPFAGCFLTPFGQVLGYQLRITQQFRDPWGGYLGLFGTHREGITRALLFLNHLGFQCRLVHLHLLLPPRLFTHHFSFTAIFHSFQPPIFQHRRNIPRLRYFDHHAIYALLLQACQQVPARLRNFLGFIIPTFIYITGGSLSTLAHSLRQL